MSNMINNIHTEMLFSRVGMVRASMVTQIALNYTSPGYGFGLMEGLTTLAWAFPNIRVVHIFISNQTTRPTLSRFMNHTFSIEKYCHETVPHPNCAGVPTDLLRRDTQNTFRNAHGFFVLDDGVESFDFDDGDLEPPSVVDANGHYILP